MTDYSYRVTFDPLNTDVDITDFVERIQWTEIGTGEIRSATLRLNAQFGQFISNDTVGRTPIIDEFDQITIFVTDREGTIFDTIYEVDTLRPINDTQQGTVLEVEMLGREHNLTKVMFAKPFFFEDAFKVFTDIGDFYNDPDSKGSLQAQLLGHNTTNTNTLPEFTANEFRFDLQEQTVYDGMINVVDRMGSSVAAGGGGDFWELVFIDIPISNQIISHVYISGNPPDQQTGGVFDPLKTITIDDTLAVNPAEEEGGIEATRGTVVGSWGANGFGSLPVAVQQFSGANTAWRLVQEYNNALTYPTDSLVTTSDKNADGDQRHFLALQTASPANPPPSSGDTAFWEERTFQEYLVRNNISLEYSPWTNFRVTAWRVAGANPNGTLAGNTPSFTQNNACWDSNLIIVDTDGSRTMADIRAITTVDTTNGVPSQYKYSGTDLYRGFRIMVDVINMGAVGAPFDQNSGLDADGNAFANNLVQHNGGQFTGAEEWQNWNVFRTITDFNLIAIDHEGVVYQKIDGGISAGSLPVWEVATIFNPFAYNPDDRVQHLGIAYQCEFFNIPIVGAEPNVPLGIWTVLPASDELRDMSESTELFNDCYHIPTSIDSDPDGGFFQKPSDGGTSNFGANSAIRYTYEFLRSDYFDFNPISGTKAEYYRVGAWANFKFPYPANSFKGDTIGEEYGNNPTKREPVTLDTSNMHFTHSGKIGFNNDEAEDLGGLTSLFTAQKFRYKAGNVDDDTKIIAYGNIPCRCVCYDTSDNVVVQDYTIPFNDQWTQVVLPLAGFQTYRARTPAKWASITKAFVKQVEVLNVFEWKNLKKVGFQWLRTYDGQGRFNPPIGDAFGDLILQDGINLFDNDVRVDWSFDQMYFSKSNLVVTAPDTNRALMPVFADMPLMNNHISQVQATDALLEITSFRHQQYDITTEGIFNIDFADSFFLENSFLVGVDQKPLAAFPAWDSGTIYLTGDNVQDAGIAYTAIEGSQNQQPPNATFWSSVAIPVPNTIKLVAKKIVYTIDKQPQGAGGFLRALTGIARIE